MDLIRIKGVGFNEFSEPDANIITNETFTASKQFLIVSSYPIPKNTNIYMEILITSNDVINTARHLPIYLGIHKDPSYGILNNNCIFMSCYYNTMSGYRLFERYQTEGLLQKNEQEVGSILSRLPIVGSIIGLGIDREGNISIYNNGNKLYTFKPTLFDMNEDEDEYYFAIYSNQSNNINGRLNFGRIKLEYIPEDYYSLYQIYFPSIYRSNYFSEEEEEIIEGTKISKLFECKLEVSETSYPIDELTNRRAIYLDRHGTDTDKYNFIMTSNGDNEMCEINLPCPMSPVYVEVRVTNASIGNDDSGFPYIGMPLEVGLTIKKNDIQNSSFRLLLYHIRGSSYQCCSIFDGEVTYYNFPNSKNPCQPIQPNVVGLEFNRAKNKIIVITANRVYVEIDIKGIDVSNNEDDYYIFFRSADNIYSGEIYGYVNLGLEETTSYSKPDDSMTIYEYWNSGIRFYLVEDPEVSCHMTVTAAHDNFNKDFYGQVYVEKDENNRRGLNRLFDTHNTITDKNAHRNIPDISMNELRTLMNNDGKL